jgi:hypothetical protein
MFVKKNDILNTYEKVEYDKLGKLKFLIKIYMKGYKEILEELKINQ